MQNIQTENIVQAPVAKRSKIRITESSEDSSSNGKKKQSKSKSKKKSGSSGCSSKDCVKSEEEVKPSVRMNRSKSDHTEDHISTRKSKTRLVRSNKSNAAVKRKEKYKRVDLLSKTKHLVVCNEDKKRKKQIKLAAGFLLSTNQSLREFSKMIVKRANMYKKKITPDFLKTDDDVLKTERKLGKMLNCINENVSRIQEALEQHMKDWATAVDSPEVKNEDSRTVTDELVKESMAAGSENVEDTVNKDEC